MNATADKISNVTVTLKANIYFDGGVISHSLAHTDGKRQTVGIIRPGKYHFNTDAPERMDIIAGQCEVLLTGESQWKSYKGGQFFNVPGKSGFDIRVHEGVAEYLCSFK